MIVLWLQVALCLWAACTLVAIEAALTSLPLAQVQRAVEQRVRGSRRVLFSLQAAGHNQVALRTLHLFLVSGVAVAATSLAHVYATRTALWPLVAAAPLLVLALGDICARFVGRAHALKLACATIGCVQGLSVILAPVVRPLSWLGLIWARYFRLNEPISPPLWTLNVKPHLSHRSDAGPTGDRNEDLFVSLTEFSDTIIREVMVPRTDMAVVSLQASRDEVHTLVLQAGHSRVPVYDDTIDNVVGVLHVKDLFVGNLEQRITDSTFVLANLLRPTFYVPEVMKISVLLREFQRLKTHLAIVVDEYGGTAGVVTLEDILEEIVGEIQDEYDVEEKQFRVLTDNKILADARVSIWDLEQALGVQFPAESEYETLAGFLMSRTGSLPAKGAVITWMNLRFVIKEANEKRIGMVEIERRLAKSLVGGG